ncbi:Uncharacterized protein Fot_19643 [Forsythia ovata]|uniref:Uncharacterized protein n=1 Tax=Forsythia ovata TaxID=205694 RepID=A0ABD1VLZ4_9LAMI
MKLVLSCPGPVHNYLLHPLAHSLILPPPTLSFSEWVPKLAPSQVLMREMMKLEKMADVLKEGRRCTIPVDSSGGTIDISKSAISIKKFKKWMDNNLLFCLFLDLFGLYQLFLQL